MLKTKLKIKLPGALKTIGFITIAILVSKMLGFLRDIVFASNYGAGNVADAFVVSSRLPLLFFDLTLGTAILSAFIPVFNDLLNKESKERAFQFANTFFNFIFLISVAISVIALIFSKQFVLLMAPDLADVSLAISLLYILFPSLIFTALAYVFVGVLQSLGEFNIPAVISVVSNLVVIIYLLFFNWIGGIYGVAWAILIGWGLQIVVQIPSLIKRGYKWRFILNFREKHLKTSIKMALPIIFASWVQPICVLINTNFSSTIGEGSIAVMDYANKLYVLFTGVFSFAITNYIFPKMSASFSKGNMEEYNGFLNKSLISIVFLMLPIMFFTLFFSEPLIKIFYYHGAFTLENVKMTAIALANYAFGMVALGANEILNKAFYAQKKTKIPMIGSFIGIFANVLMILIFKNLGLLSVATLALSVAIGSNANMMFLLIANKRTKSINA